MAQKSALLLVIASLSLQLVSGFVGSLGITCNLDEPAKERSERYDMPCYPTKLLRRARQLPRLKSSRSNENVGREEQRLGVFEGDRFPDPGDKNLTRAIWTCGKDVSIDLIYNDVEWHRIHQGEVAVTLTNADGVAMGKSVLVKEGQWIKTPANCRVRWTVIRAIKLQTTYAEPFRLVASGFILAPPLPKALFKSKEEGTSEVQPQAPQSYRKRITKFIERTTQGASAFLEDLSNPLSVGRETDCFTDMKPLFNQTGIK
uniref:Uncharacterized protein n=1 Tax=Hanusia phi TaxID=3032 RepID=A0A6T7N2B5_9CRYP|mmetsp:Transcript_15830/g.36200  ORF Transcript_15830/g.36200 Transcript_15830/m.36200 type:complete len:259 (+) Transcript_15830:447-1223(+)|eukprot:765616-Hanusia_phi.AAC.2